MGLVTIFDQKGRHLTRYLTRQLQAAVSGPFHHFRLYSINGSSFLYLPIALSGDLHTDIHSSIRIIIEKPTPPAIKPIIITLSLSRSLIPLPIYGPRS